MKKYIVIILMFCTSNLFSQNYSTSAGRFLLLGAGARPGALGGAYTAVGEDATTITWNPGGLGFVKSFELAFMHMAYDEDLSYEYAAATIPLDFGTFGLNFIYMGMSPLAEMSAGDETGRSIDFSDMALSFSFGKEFFNGIGMGINAKYIKSSLGVADTADYYPASGFAFDFGALAGFDFLRLYNKPEKNFRVGVALQNIGTKLKYDVGKFSLPMVIRPGIFYKPIRFAEVMADYNYIMDSPSTINAGIEILPEWILSPRGGIRIKDKLMTYTFGGGLKYNVGSFLLQVDYAYNMDPYFKTHMISIALRKFSALLAEFGIGDVFIKNVFPAMYKYYTKNPVTTVEIKNNTNIPIEKIKVTMFVNKNMDFPSESKEISSLSPGDKISIELPADFNNEILKITEDTPMQAQIKVDYVAEGKRLQLSTTKSFKLHNRYSMTWDNFDKLAAFVTPKDIPIQAFARGIAQQYRDVKVKNLPDSLIQASVIFNALGSMGLTYVLDPQSPYRQKDNTTEIVDQIQYPRDTLRYKTGDCDDCSVLFCALLENIGLNSAFVDVKDHIFMMFDTGVPEDEALLKFGNPDLYILRNGTVWLPVETTMFGKGFTDAWIFAANTYRGAEAKGLVTFIEVKKAWETFYPVTLPSTDWESPYPSRVKMEEYIIKDKKRFNTLGMEDKLNDLKGQLKKNPNNSEILNKLSIIYGNMDQMDIAEKYLKNAIKINPNGSKYYNNLANIYFLKNNLDEALKYYKKAIELTPDNANYRVNLSNLYNVMGDADAAEKEMKEAEKLLAVEKEK